MMKTIGYIITRIICGAATIAVVVFLINAINWLCDNVAVFNRILGIIAIAGILFLIGWIVTGVTETIRNAWKGEED